MFGWFMEPCFSGKYPDIMIKNVTGGRLPEFTQEQANLLKGSYDFIGFNYYSSYYATTLKPSQEPSYLTDSLVDKRPEGLDGKLIGPKAAGDWLYSYPPGFYKVLMHIKHTYGDPVILITENGWSEENHNDIEIEVACADIKRIDYHHSHLQYLRDAIRDGVRVVGYFAWSLMDNFEWKDGYSVRFGLFYVDYNDGKYTRYPKNSAIWFMNFLENHKKVSEKKKLHEETMVQSLVSNTRFPVISYLRRLSGRLLRRASGKNEFFRRTFLDCHPSGIHRRCCCLAFSTLPSLPPVDLLPEKGKRDAGSKSPATSSCHHRNPPATSLLPPVNHHYHLLLLAAVISHEAETQ
ncbi:unnamed protein product [Lactuca virosa]|uniref:Thioglucosidase n=1 Tax=Lactuca virosa TaxID=75947 RepID=A0AAU9NY15_9ASTR|nr:unnamed protein product [Lactuca virosa]